jgi:sugar/nucleoside kinase (ribokinase family)
MRAFTRLLHLGNVVVDVLLSIPALPDRGADVIADASQVTPGGGLNVMVAAARQGLPVAYAGAHGSGPFATLALSALREAGVEILQSPRAGVDTGFVIGLVERTGERTFVTSPGAEATLTTRDLAGIHAAASDAVYVSGYGLLRDGSRRGLLHWLARLGDDAVVFFDPGPFAGELPLRVLDQVIARTDWLTCNAREAGQLSGRADPVAAARQLARSGERAGGGTSACPRRGVIVRAGPDGSVICQVSSDPVSVPGFAVDVLDTTGAGDTHTGTCIAELARGTEVAGAVRVANAAAALSVTRHGPATAPTAAELAHFLAQDHGSGPANTGE